MLREACAPDLKSVLPNSLVIWALDLENRRLRARAFQFLILLVAKEPRIAAEHPEIFAELEALRE